MRSAAAALALLLVVASTSAVSQPEARLVRIGVVFYTTQLRDTVGAEPASLVARALVRGLRENGWVDGRNARIVWRSAEGHYERIPGLVEELVRMPVDILVAAGNDIAAESVKRSPALPVVLGSSDYPVETGLVASYSRPGGSITGLTNWIGRSLNAKRLALLKETVPGVTRIAVFGPAERSAEARFSPETQAAADALGVTMFRVGVDRLADLERAFDQALRSGANGIFVVDYPFAFLKQNQLRLSELAAKYRLPVIHSASNAGDAGALLTYAPDITENFRRAGHFVDKILRGAKPGELPIEQPTKLELIVNLKAARAIGLTIPPSVLTQASRIIE